MRLGLGLGLVRLGKAIASFVRDGLKLYYPFRDNDPELLLSGATSFDGSNYINAGADSSLNLSVFTISLWVNFTDGAGAEQAIRKWGSNRGIAIGTSGDVTNKFRFQASNSSSEKYVDSSTTVVANTWYHLTGTADGSNIKLYVNGSLENTVSSTITLDTASDNLYIGGFSSVKLNGKIANFGIWNRALSASEIESIYWRGQYADLKGTELTNLVSWYNLSADANDSTGTNNGTNNGATFLTDAYSASSPFLPRIQDKASDTIANYGEVYGGNAVSFDGSNDYVSLNDATFMNGASAFTISVWALHDNTGSDIIFTTDTELLLGYSSGKVTASYRETDNTRNRKITTNAVDSSKWYHIVATWDKATDGEIKLYINGDYVAQSYNDGGASTANVLKDASSVRIGAWIDGSQPMDGLISHLKILNVALTQDQVRELYIKPELTLPTGITSSALKLDMPMQEGSGIAILDGSPTFLDVAINGDFSADAVGSTSVTGWSVNDFTAEVIADGYSGNAVQLTRVDSGTQSFYQDLSGITSGNEYKINAKLKAIGGSVSAGIRVTTPTNSNPSSNIVSLPADGSWQDLELSFTAQGTTARIQIQRQESDPGSIVVDDVIINQLNLGQNHGTGSGITWATGQEYGFQHPLVRSNNPMVFDGNDDRITNSFDNSAQDATYSFWAKSSKTTANTVFGHGASNKAFHLNFSAGRPILYLAGTYFKYWNDNSAQDDNQWHHYVVVVDVSDANGSKLYIDGSEQTVSAVNNSVPADAYSQGLTIGAQQQSGGVSFDGVINEFAVWHKFLTANEITALYNSGLPLLPTTDSGNYASADDLVGYWRNDGVITWTDRSTNSNNGTVSGTPASIIIPEGLNEGRDSQGYYLTDTDSISSGIRLKGAEHIEIDNSEALTFGTGDFSYDFWFKWTDAGHKASVVNASGVMFTSHSTNINNYSRIMSYFGTLFYTIKYGGSDVRTVNSAEGAISSANTWYHIALTVDRSSGGKWYINGSESTLSGETGATETNDLNFTGKIRIGAINYAESSDGSFIGGSIDEFRIYKGKVLSATEVLKNYNNGKSAHSN